MDLVVTSDNDGSEILKILRDLHVSRSEISRMKRRPDGIMLNGVHATVRDKVRKGDFLYFSREDREEDAGGNIEPVDLPVDIIYEDELVVAFNKPSGMPTHPGHGHQRDTLANAAAFMFRDSGEPFVFRPVNRLDRDTSGAVIIAKSKYFAYVMSKLFLSGKVEKEYYCLLDGVPGDGNPVRVVKNIKRKLPSIIERETCPDDEGQYAETFFEPLGCENGICRCVAKPKTGRTHQIRVHAAFLGTPVLGDTLYGRPSELIGRQALHCMSIKYNLETDRGLKKICISAPLAPDIQRITDNE